MFYRVTLFLHQSYGNQVCENGDEKDELVVASEVAVPVVDGASSSAGFKAVSTKDPEEGGGGEEEDQMPGERDEDPAVFGSFV